VVAINILSMKFRTVAQITEAGEVAMGPLTVKQPLPTQRVERVDPFLLLHHFGPLEVEPGYDPLDLGPHPHRGFEPVTFLYQGGIRHRDSRGNTGHLEAGDVQWMTAGMGIIHSERASKVFREQGGTLEGIQFWVNLPKKDKMVQPRYQDIKAADIPRYTTADGLATVKVVAGQFGDLCGPALTHTPIQAWQLSLRVGGALELPLPAEHEALLYVLHGDVKLNNNWNYTDGKMLVFRQDGEGIQLTGLAEDSELLLLSGEPLREPVAQWGPYVMNTQTEIMKAMRDYQMGKMGMYTEY
jgi:redox-sensitive bicupin YhaK (pirin superfamily)